MSGPVATTHSEDGALAVIDLLSGATDPNPADILSAVNLTLVSGDAAGISLGTNELTLDPDAYNHLAVNENEVISYTLRHRRRSRWDYRANCHHHHCWIKRCATDDRDG